MSRNLFLFAFSCVCLFLTASCSDQSIQHGSSERFQPPPSFARRSVKGGDQLERGTRDFMFPSEDRRFHSRQDDVDSLEGESKGLAKNHLRGVPLRDQATASGFSSLVPFKNGHPEIGGLPGLPGHPVRKVFGFVLDKVRPKPRPEDDCDETDEEERRSTRRLFEHGKGILGNMKQNAESAGVGVHKAVRLGPLSVKFDVGNP